MKRIVVVGRSNVGKSSLIKALTGKNIEIGKRPGMTLEFKEYPYKNFILVDFPGFGFMKNVREERQEQLKDEIVRYIESKEFSRAIEVIDTKAFLDIYERWVETQIPVEIEFYHFLHEFTEPIIAANKIDKLRTYERDEILNEIAEKFGLLTPWDRNRNFVPISAKKGENIDTLEKILLP